MHNLVIWIDQMEETKTNANERNQTNVNKMNDQFEYAWINKMNDLI